MVNNRDREIMGLAHRNLENVIRRRVGCCSGGELVEGDGYIMYTVGEESFDAHLNGLMLTDAMDYEKARAVFQKAVEYFGSKGIGFTVWIRDGEDGPLERYLEGMGKSPKRRPGSAVMYVERPFQDIASTAVKSGGCDEQLNVASVRSSAGGPLAECDEAVMNDYMEIIGESFDKSPSLSRMIVETSACGTGGKDEAGHDTEDAMEQSSISVAYMGKKAVGGSITYVKDEIGGIYWLGVKTDSRRMGLGSLLTRTSANEAFSNGARIVILQASLAGEEVYGRLGFRTVSRYRSYDIR